MICRKASENPYIGKEKRTICTTKKGNCRRSIKDRTRTSSKTELLINEDKILFKLFSKMLTDLDSSHIGGFFGHTLKQAVLSMPR